MLLALLLVAANDHLTNSRVRESLAMLVSVLTLGVTTTNWVAGVSATFALSRWRRALLITMGAFFIVLGLAIVQSRFLPSVGLFVLPTMEAHPSEIANYGGGISERWRAIFFHSLVMPEMKVRDLPGFRKVRPSISVQDSQLGQGSQLVVISTALWLVLLAVGTYSFASAQSSRTFRVCLLVVFLVPLLLHSMFGVETFLYALHFIPFLILIVAWATMGPLVRLTLTLAWALIVFSAINNWMAFREACRILHSL